jgi:hypothetical protein
VACGEKRSADPIPAISQGTSSAAEKQKSIPPRPQKRVKRLDGETEETEHLCNFDLQCLVLLQQLKVAMMQIQQMSQTTDDVHD